MNYPKDSVQGENEKIYTIIQEKLAWLNDIEIGKVSYLTSILLLILNLIMIRLPMFSIKIPYVDPMTFAFHDVEELAGFEVCAYILGAISLIALIFPMLKFFEWRYRWFIPVGVTVLVESVTMFLLIQKKNEMLENTLIGYAYQLFSVQIRLTANAWLFMFINLLLMGCVVKILIDIWINHIMYRLPGETE